MPVSRSDVIELLQGKASSSTAELANQGISRQYVRLLRQAGILIRVRHGCYRLADKYQKAYDPDVFESDSH
jgi:hypothetical protein